jgi:hypothetical protein
MSNQRRQRQLRTRILEQIARAQAEGKLKPGDYYEVPVRHEAGCALLAGKGRCSCHPQVCSPERIPFLQEN